MTAEVSRCYRCGEPLVSLPLPFSRRDECPACGAHVHVCRMCAYFDPAVPKKCREDDAEEVIEKERVNFCEWFKPGLNTFNPARAKAAVRAQSSLAALFGEGGEAPPEGDGDDLLRQAEDLFR